MQVTPLYIRKDEGKQRPEISLEHLLGHIFNIPLPPGQTLFKPIKIHPRFYAEKRARRFLEQKVRSRHTVAEAVIGGLRNLHKRKALGTLRGVLDDGTTTSAQASSSLELPLVSLGESVVTQAAQLPQHRSRSKRSVILDVRRLHDLLMAAHPEVLQVTTETALQPSLESHFLLKQREAVYHRDKSHGVANDENVAVPLFCTAKALNEIRALTIESEIKWAEILSAFPREHRRNYSIIMSSDRIPYGLSPLVCPLTDQKFQKIITGVKPEEKVEVQEGVTLNGVFNDWPHNKGRSTESIQSLSRESMADAFRHSKEERLKSIENGVLTHHGYIDIGNLRKICAEPHMVTRYGNTLNRLYKAELWAINLYENSNQAVESDWWSLLQEVGYWPTFELRNL